MNLDTAVALSHTNFIYKLYVRTVVDTVGGKEAEGVWEHGVEENIWTWTNEVTGDWRRLHNEQLNDLYSSPNIVRVIKSRRMRWAGHVGRMGEESNDMFQW